MESLPWQLPCDALMQTQVTLACLPVQAYRNTVSVPRHWSQKRKYLQGKRGIEKPPFKLPDFIEATGEEGVVDGAWEGTPSHITVHN